MEKFNKNNPYIIIAKKVYDSIIDKIQIFGKLCVLSTIIFIIAQCIITSVLIINMIFNKQYLFNIIAIIILFLSHVSYIISIRNKIQYFISSSPAIKEFSRISELEVNDILALNNEDVLKCVHGLYELRGELTTTNKFYNFMFYVNIGIEVVLLIFIIIILLLI